MTRVGIAGRSERPGWLAGIALSAVVVFEATEEGTHTIEFSIDGASESLPLHVVENAA